MGVVARELLGATGPSGDGVDAGQVGRQRCDQLTTRACRPASKAGHSRLITTKCPRWFVANCDSQPLPTRRSGGAMISAEAITRSTAGCDVRKRSRGRFGRPNPSEPGPRPVFQTLRGGYSQ